MWCPLGGHELAYFCKVECLGQHYDGADLLLPNHTPKVVNRFFGWALCDDVRIWLQQTLSWWRS